MKIAASKYFILAIAGALILGAGLYLFLNNHFEKIEIIAAKTFLEKNKIIEPGDVVGIECLKSSLPDGYMTDASEAVGKVLLADRHPMDPVTDSVFKESSDEGLVSALKEGEVLIALNIDYEEPVVSELIAGSRISIISSEKEEGLQGQNSQAGNYSGIPGKTADDVMFVEGSIIETNIFSLSENIIVIDGQVVIKDLEVLSISKTDDSKSRPIAGGSVNQIFIYLKCEIKEAPAIARVTEDGKYKIVVEKS